MNLKQRPAMPKQETDLSPLERFENGQWLTTLEYSLILGIPLTELDQRRRLGQLSPLVEKERRSPLSWFFRKKHD